MPDMQVGSSLRKFQRYPYPIFIWKMKKRSPCPQSDKVLQVEVVQRSRGSSVFVRSPAAQDTAAMRYAVTLENGVVVKLPPASKIIEASSYFTSGLNLAQSGSFSLGCRPSRGNLKHLLRRTAMDGDAADPPAAPAEEVGVHARLSDFTAPATPSTFPSIHATGT